MGNDMPVVAIPFSNSSNVLAIPVASTGTVYTNKIPLDYGQSFAFDVICAGTTIDVDISVLEGNFPATTEFAADANYVVPSSATDPLINPTSTTKIIKAFAPVTSRFVMLKLVGSGSNAADVTVTIYLIKQERT